MGNKCSCGKACICIGVVSFIASFLFLLFIIPVSLNIRDRDSSLDVVSVHSAAGTSTSILLKEVDGLWHWEATVTVQATDLTAINDNITLSVIPEKDLVYVWNNYTAIVSSPYIVYALKGSHLWLFNSTDLFTVTSAIKGALLCDHCDSYQITENGFYNISTLRTNTTVSIELQLLVIDQLMQQSQQSCSLTNDSRQCKLIFHKLHSYYIIASTDASSINYEAVTLSLSEGGRQTWYILLVLLAIPMILSAIGLMIVLICIKCC